MSRSLSPRRSRSFSPMDRSPSESPLRREPDQNGRDFATQISRSPRREPISLYISGLASKVTDEDLKDHFRAEGKINEARVVLDPRTQESRGFGFVDYNHPEDAEKAIKYLDKTALRGRVIIVEKAKRARPRTPTPGEYKGVRPTDPTPRGYERDSERHRDRDRDRRYDRDRERYDRYDRYRQDRARYERRRSPSPYRRSRRHSPSYY